MRGGVRRQGGCRQRQRLEALVEVGGEGGVDKGRAGGAAAVTAEESRPCWRGGDGGGRGFAAAMSARVNRAAGARKDRAHFKKLK